MGPDNLSLYERKKSEKPVHIISVPLELGSDERGLAKAPQYLFERGLLKAVAACGRAVCGSEVIPCPAPTRVVSGGNAKYLNEIAAVGKRAHAATVKAARAGSVVVALGGDHSAAMGTITGAASAHESLGVIYIDSHPDCNTDETTISGNVHGMVASTAMGFGHRALTALAARPLSPQHFLYLGVKDFDQAEIDFIRRESIHTVTMHDIALRGLQIAIDAINALRQKTRRVWVSMDMDSIDEGDAPGVGLAVKDGFARREILALAQYIGKNCDVAGLDIVEVLPAKDKNGATAQLALELMARFLGGEHTWYAGYMDSYRETNVTKAVKPTKKPGKSTRRIPVRVR